MEIEIYKKEGERKRERNDMRIRNSNSYNEI